MTAKEIKNNTKTDESVEDIKLSKVIPSTGLDTSEIVSDQGVVSSGESVIDASVASGIPEASKTFLGRKARGDNARRGSRSGGPSSRGGRSGRTGDNRERIKPEFDSKIIDIRRVTRVTSGGRRMNFSVAVVAGDRKGRVGIGLGKGIDTAVSVEKATREAKKHLIKVPLSPQMTIPHAVEAKFGSACIMVFPARGRGIVAGSSARVVIELAGIKDVCAKILSGSKNRINNAKATIEALKKLSKVGRSVNKEEKKKI